MRPSIAFDRLMLLAAVFGAINWGLVGVFRFDLVAWSFDGMEFGQTSGSSRLVYAALGLAGVYWLVVPTLVGASIRAETRDDPQTRDPAR